MLGSPNYFFGIYNGSDAKDPNITHASTIIQKSFEEYCTSNDFPFELTEFTGRSDYGPFIENGIPAGGLFSGAEVIKTSQQRSKFGGIANAAYDPCYHQKCDSVQNIDSRAFERMSKAAAYVLEKFATIENLKSFLNSESI